MDNRSIQLLEASFRGVPFRVRSESKSDAGRKIVLHDYVNSSERFVEDQGQIPPRFTIEAFVHGENFKSLANSLEQALNQRGSGRLVLPTLGAFQVYAMPYTVKASQTEVGEIVFSLDFATGRPAAGPIEAAIDPTQVFALGDTARQSIQGALGDLWSTPSTASNSAVSASDFVGSLNDILEKYSASMPSSNLTALSSKISRLERTASQIIRDPSSLAANLIGGTPEDAGIWQEISLGLGSNNSGFSTLIQSMGFGGSDFTYSSGINGASASYNPVQSGDNTIPIWQETTAQRIARNKNRINLFNSQRLSALVAGYEVAANSDYETQSDIDSVVLQLEENHERIMRDDTIDKNIIQSNPNVRTAIENVRLAALNVIDQKKQQAFNVTSTKLNYPSSSFVQAYAFYAEEFTNTSELEDRTLQLRGLNPEKPAIALDGEISIFRTT